MHTVKQSESRYF